MERTRAREKAERKEAEMEDQIQSVGLQLRYRYSGKRKENEEGKEEEQERKRQRIAIDWEQLTGLEKVHILDIRLSFAQTDIDKDPRCEGVKLGGCEVGDEDEDVYEKIEKLILHCKTFYIGCTYSPAIRWVGDKAKDMKGHCKKYQEMAVVGIRGNFEGGILEKKMIKRFMADDCYKHWCDNEAEDSRGITTKKPRLVDWKNGEGIHFVYVCYNY